MVVGEFTRETDLLVIGGGPGGYTAAFRAAELGIQTVIVDGRDTLGGVCLHEGCIPSKTLLHAAETIHIADRAGDFGVRYQPPEIDVAKLRAWVDQTIGRLTGGLATLAKKADVELIQGHARFEDNKHVAIPGGAVPRVKFRRAIVATGSRPIEHQALPFDGARVVRPGEAVRLERVPPRLLVIGSGYQGVEIATIYAALGSEVALVTEDDRLLAEADADLVRPLERQLKRSMKSIETGATITAATAEGFDMVVVAIGQRPNVDELDLQLAGVETADDGTIVVNEQMKTSVGRIYAIGDVTGRPYLADRAMHQGRVAAEAVAGWGSVFDARGTTHVVFTDPQLAWCGLTEAAAAAEGYTVDVKKIPWGASGRAVGMGRGGDGVTKIIYDTDSKLILGVGLCGPHAAEMIAEGALAVEMGAELTDLADTIHPHPTMSELVSDVARSGANSGTEAEAHIEAGR